MSSSATTALFFPTKSKTIMNTANIQKNANVVYPKLFEFYKPYESIDDIKKKDLKLISKNKGIQRLLCNEKIDIDAINWALKLNRYEKALFDMHAALVKLQNWIIDNKKRVIIIFEGRDAAGKDGTIRTIIERLNARHYTINALPKPTEQEEKMWYFQRYVYRFPRPTEICFFNRSWYNRAVVEPVNGFCTKKQYEQFMADVVEFEKMLTSDDTYLLKIYFSIDYDEQGKRLHEIQSNPLKRWKFTDVDAKAQELWGEYTSYKEAMFEKTSTEFAKWAIVEANDKKTARLTCMQYILDQFDYENKK